MLGDQRAAMPAAAQLTWEPSSSLCRDPWKIPSMNSQCSGCTQGNAVQGLMCVNGPRDPLKGSESAVVQIELYQSGARKEVSPGELKLQLIMMQQ